MFGYPIAIWLPAFYAGELGLSLAAVGTMIMLARLTDVVTDPVIGFFSDRSKSRFGRRKPFMVGGLPFLVLGVVMLFIPRQLGIETIGQIHLVFWISFMFLGSTLVYIPYYAWGAELSSDYNERSRITAVRSHSLYGGIDRRGRCRARPRQSAGGNGTGHYGSHAIACAICGLAGA